MSWLRARFHEKGFLCFSLPACQKKSNAIKSDPTFSVSEVNVDSSIRYGKSFNESYEPHSKLEGAQE